MVKEVMGQVAGQFLKIWRGAKPIQKMTAFTVLLCVIGALGYLILRPSSHHYVPLFPKGNLQSSEVLEIKNYLEHFSIPYKDGKERGPLVHKDYVDRLQGELATWTIPQGKGFELFDSNTWIKGEKELQVLEMRALKGQLEKDLAGFDYIKSASVILDIPPSRNFGQTQYKTKASVILTLMPGTRLSTSQLRAITFHLAGAVRGLESNMIAISDTKGKLYKAIDPDGEKENTELLFEENIQDKIDEMLTKIVGSDHYFSSVQVALNPRDEQILTLAISVVIDQTVDANLHKDGIKRQIQSLAKGYGAEIETTVDFIPFEKKKVHLPLIKKKERTGLGFGITLFVVLLAILSSFPLFKRFAKKTNTDDSLFKMMTQVDTDLLADSVKGENPETIALMVSYLEPKKAEKMIAAFPPDLQEQIMFYLSELEKES